MIGIAAGIAAFSAAGGVAAGATAIAVGAAAMAGTMMLEQIMKPDMPDTKQAVQLGDKATPIDKSQAQAEKQVGKLKLGEAEDKKNRKKGKAAFKNELDKKEKKTDDKTPATGVQVKAPKQTGVQL